MPGLFFTTGLRPLPSKYFPIHHSFITLSFEASCHKKQSKAVPLHTMVALEGEEV
jgi:hypothetical protein